MPVAGNWNVFGVNLPDFGILKGKGGSTYTAGAYYPTKKAYESTPKLLMSDKDADVLGAATSGALQGPIQQTPPPVTPAPTDKKKTDSGGGSSDKQKRGVDKARQDQEKAAEAQRQAFQAQIDSEYNDITGQLNTQEGALNAQLPLTEQQITGSYGDTSAQLGYDQSSAEANLAGQQASAEQATGGVLNQARRTYNELQSGASRFGGSAAEAYGELLGRSTAQTMGDARTALATTISGIKSELGRVKNFYNQKKTDLQKNMNLAIEQARKDVRDQVATINANRNQARNWKASQNMTALANFQQNVANIRSAAQQAQQAIDQWMMAREDTLKATAADSVKQFQVTLPQATNIASGVASVTGNKLGGTTIADILGQVGKDSRDVDWKRYLSTIQANDDKLYEE